MKKFLLPEGKGYKANLHCHTLLSDGCLSPAEIKEAYKAHGYSVVAFSDHEALCDHADLCDDTFIALNAYETAIKPEQASTLLRPNMKVHHLNLIKRRPHDLTQVCFFPENFTPGNCAAQIPFLRYVGEPCRYRYDAAFVRHLIQEAHENGFLVHYNHPRWSLQTPEEVALLCGPGGVDGLELLNTGCRYHGDYDASFYQALARLGVMPYAVAGDDNHNGLKDPPSMFYGGFTVIKPSAFTYEGITDALAAGNSYVSTGPVIHSIAVENGFFTLRTSPALTVTLHSEGRGFAVKEGIDGYINAAAFPIQPERYGAFVRFEVRDKEGNTAYTRVYAQNEWKEGL